MNERQFAEAALFATFVGVPLIAAGLFGLCMLFEATWTVWWGATAVMIVILFAPLVLHGPEALPIMSNPLLLPVAAYGVPMFVAGLGWVSNRRVAAHGGE